MIAGIVDIMILVLIFGYCTYLIYKRYQEKKTEKEAVWAAVAVADHVQDATHLSDRKKKKIINWNLKKISEKQNKTQQNRNFS